MLVSLGTTRADSAKTPQLQPAIPPTATDVVTVEQPVLTDPTALSVELQFVTIGVRNRGDEIVPVPNRKEEAKSGAAPNPTPSLHILSEPKEESGVVHLTIYNCIGKNGGFCPGGAYTASGTVLEKGTASCDPKFLGRRFAVVGDPEHIIWTCLDTGNFRYPLFDLWFYNLSDGLNYLSNIPGPERIAFVD